MRRVLIGAAFALMATSGTACRPNAEQRAWEAAAFEVLEGAGYNPIDVTVDWPKDEVVTVVLGGSPDTAAAAEVVAEHLPPESTLHIWAGLTMTLFTSDSLVQGFGVPR